MIWLPPRTLVYTSFVFDASALQSWVPFYLFRQHSFFCNWSLLQLKYFREVICAELSKENETCSGPSPAQMEPEWQAYHSWRRFAAWHTVFTSRHSNIRRTFLSTFSWRGKKKSNHRHPSWTQQAPSWQFQHPFYTEAAHRQPRIMTASSSSSSSHSHPRDETPEKVSQWISQFKISWVKSETCLGALPNCRTPRPWKTSVAFCGALALRTCASRSALNCIANWYC